MKSTAELLRPLYDLQRELVLQSSVMWTDDTRVTVLGGREGSFQGHFWTYIGDKQHPYSVYDSTTNHSRDGPARFLWDYSGYLHADELRLEEMLPERWAVAHPEAILTHRLEESRAKAARTRQRRAHRRRARPK